MYRADPRCHVRQRATAIRDYFNHERYYLAIGGNKVTVTSDHTPLQFTLTQLLVTSRQMRTIHDFTEFNLNNKNLMRGKNYVQNALSRRWITMIHHATSDYVKKVSRVVGSGGGKRAVARSRFTVRRRVRVNG